MPMRKSSGWSVGIPLHPVGRFRDSFERYAHRWINKHVNSLEVSFTNKPQLQRWMEDYGEDSDFVRTRVLGEFPRTASTQFIGPSWFKKRWTESLFHRVLIHW